MEPGSSGGNAVVCIGVHGERCRYRSGALEGDEIVLKAFDLDVGLNHSCKGNNLHIIQEPAVESAVGVGSAGVGSRMYGDSRSGVDTLDLDGFALPLKLVRVGELSGLGSAVDGTLSFNLDYQYNVVTAIPAPVEAEKDVLGALDGKSRKPYAVAVVGLAEFQVVALADIDGLGRVEHRLVTHGAGKGGLEIRDGISVTVVDGRIAFHTVALGSAVGLVPLYERSHPVEIVLERQWLADYRGCALVLEIHEYECWELGADTYVIATDNNLASVESRDVLDRLEYDSHLLAIYAELA